ncbi:hypothetical protein AZI86_17045 [Bdellovibrio bacteriovorus]|uniref:Fibronectin type-III domain-containing protein n=1 Tax=Bdellovibrio bacteriovorus TaxID=959 RepID=A0A150WEN4_BDEBC|nr:IPT/TIG domain-containing protein [Bdellovibrio bacteriovorus]KYG61420.1 hypothetical protein AZI86_17045 [Bdellovibrio bacteriovorus]
MIRNPVANLVISAFIVISLTGCLQSESLVSGPVATATFQGCISASGVSNSSVRVEFTFPSEADKVIVYRDGIQIGVSSISTITSILDTGLMEGVTYQYSCDAYKGASKIAGSAYVTGSPINTNAPIFNGIINAARSSNSSVKVDWNPESSSSSKASYYLIYANVGSTLDWAAIPRGKVPATGTFSMIVDGLGDELPYVFGVRACTKDDICDSNTTLKSLTLPDRGAPQTVGVSLMAGRNRTLYITAPWVSSQGGIAERRIYSCTGAGCTLPNSPTKTVAVTDITNPVQEMTIENSLDFTTYKVRVDDLDPSGNVNNSTNVMTFTTGDMTEPVFLGIGSIISISPVDKAARIGFTSAPRQGSSDAGAADGIKEYVLYIQSAPFGTVPTNACNKVVPDVVISAASYPGGNAQTYDVTNLSERTNYSFCMRARDAAGNTSSINAEATLTTGDLTAPNFGGIQSLTFRNTEKDLLLTWNPPLSADQNNYVVRIWKNNPNPSAAGTQLASFTAPKTSTSGRSITQSDYTLNDNDVVYATVDACDNASTLGLGLPDNCTTFYNSYTSAKKTTIPDIRPPQGFTSGIKAASAGATESLTEGVATVRWNRPSAPYPTDYAGFRVYSVDPASPVGAKILLKSCACAANPCSTASPDSANSDLKCDVTGLSPYRLYRLHVVAYDAVGNESTDLNPLSSYTDLRIRDTTPPGNGVFASNLEVSGLDFSWSSTTDNQYSVGNAITYKLYRKISSTFANAAAPDADGVQIYSGTVRTFTDTLSVGGVYFYGLCAFDAAGNKTCDAGNIKQVVATDVTAPLIYSFSTTKSADTLGLQKRWVLTWSADDPGGTIATNLKVSIYSKFSETENSVMATVSDTLVFTGFANTTSSGNLTGPLGKDGWINYLIVVEDSERNRTTRNLTVYSANKMAFTSVKTSTAYYGGGTLVVFEGRGFSKGSENIYGQDTVVKFSGTTCNNTKVLSDEYISCVTPAGTAGPVDITFTNPEGTILTASGAFVYNATRTDSCDIFDAAGGSSTYFANAPQNGGTANGTSESSAYLICNIAQLQLALNNSALIYYKLGRNLDLSGISGGIVNTSSFGGSLNGNGFALLDLNRTGSGQYVGAIALTTSTIQSVKFLGFNITSTNTSSTAGQAGCGIFGNSSGSSSFKNSGGVRSPVFKGITIVANIDCSSPDGARVGAIASEFGWSANSSSLAVADDDAGLRSKIVIYVKVKPSSNGGSLNTVPGVGGVVGLLVGPQNLTIRNTDIKTYLTILASTGNRWLMAGGALGFVDSSTQNFTMTRSTASLSVLSQAEASSNVFKGGVAGCIPSQVSMDQVKAKIFVNQNPGGSVGGLFGSNGCYYLMGSASITDSYALGSYTGTTTRNLAFGGTLTPASGTDSVTLQRLYSAVKFTPQSTMATSSQSPNFRVDITNNPTVSSSSVLYRVESFPYGVDAASANSIGELDADMKNQAPGNVYESSNFDFSSGGKWKWCNVGEYPRLKFEDCGINQ